MHHKHDYSTLFYLNPLPHWVYDIDTFEILDVNQATIDLYGYTKEEFLKLTIKDLRPEEEMPKLMEVHKNIHKHKGNKHFGTFTHKKKDGTIIRVETNGHRIEFEGRNCFIIVCQDVTHIEKQFLKLQESQKKLKSASEIAKIGYWKFDIQTNSMFWSDKVYDIWEIKKEDVDVSIEYFYNSIHPDDKEVYKREQEASLSGLKEPNFAHRIVLQNGTVKWVHEIGRLNKNSDGAPISFEGTVQDITSQKKEEQHLRLLESVITHTNDAVLITEAESQDRPGPKIVYVNEAFTKLTGYTIDEVIGNSPRLLQGPKTDKKELLRLGKALRNWQPCEATLLNYKKNGEAFWINFSLSPVADEKGSYTHWIAVQRDVTTAKNEQLRKELLSEISAVFNERTALNSSLERLCSLIVSYGEFNFCEVWLPTLHEKTLKLSAYANMDLASEKFHKNSKSMDEMAFNVGLPGIVWASKQTIVWDDIDKNEFFIRHKAAQKMGLKAAMGIPLTSQEDIVGVLVVGSTEANVHLKQRQAILTNMEAVIGSEINRKRLESELHHLFDTLPDIICVTDKKGHFLKMNKAGLELFGCNEHDVLGNTIDAFAHPVDKTLFNLKRKIAKKENQNSFSFENSYITKKKEFIWLHWHCNMVPGEGLIYATAKNITEEKKLHELVNDASKMARIGGWEVDLVSNKLHWSQVVHEIHETNPETFVPNAESMALFFREDYQDKVTKIITEAVHTRSTFDFEAPIITANNNQVWIRSVGTSEFVEDKCVRVFGSLQDINLRKLTELRLKSITDDLPGVAFQYYIYPDGTGKFESVSEASLKIWAVSPEACEKNNALVWNQIKMGGDYDQLFHEIQQSIDTCSQWHGKWRNVLPNGDLRWHEGYGTPYKLSNGTILFNTMVFDITEEVKLSNLYDETSRLSKIGSWELDLTNRNNDAMYWSPVVREIIEIDTDYDASLTGGIEFYTEESKVIVKRAIEQLIKKGIDYDEEVLLITQAGKKKWVRVIGKSERINGVCTKIFGSIQDIHAMKNSEIQLKEILESISDAFYAVDEHWNITYFNKEAENLLKRKSNEVLGKNFWEEFAHNRGTELELVYRKVAKTGKPINFEYLSPADASWYEINAYPSRGGVSSYFKKIDERKRIAEELQKAYEEKNQILESIGDAFFAVDKNWKVTYWNKEAENVLGRKREVILGKNLWVEYADAIDSDFHRQYHKAMKTGNTVIFEEYYPALHKWFEVTAYPNLKGLSVYFKDVTLRKETDIRILQANERFEKVAQATTDAIWDWDIENDIFHRGEGFDKLFGYEVKKTFTGDGLWKDTFHPKDLPNLKTSLMEFLQDPSKEYWRHEYRILHISGEEKTVLDKGVIIRDDKGKPIRMVGAITDISHRAMHEKEVLELNKTLKKHIKELEISNQELEQFAYIASHDLQEPLRMISSFLNQLQRKYGDQLDEKAHQYIYFATDGAKRMKQIILDLLDYSRVGKEIHNLENINLNKLLEEYGILRRRLIEEKKATLISKHMPIVKCFRAPLVQTLHCLLDNAIKYSEENIPPVINISVSETKDNWLISIADNGIGIDPQFFEKIFIIFQRLHNRDKFEGTGIGLSIAKKHVELWGGKIWVESQISKGSTFYFTIDKNIETNI